MNGRAKSLRNMPWTLMGQEVAAGNAGKRFLALPSRHRPRWLLPENGAHFVSRGLDLYAPATLGGQAYKLGLLALAASGVGALFKSRVIIVNERADSVLAEVRKRLADGATCSCAISCGTPGPDEKLTVQLMSRAGDVVAFAKIGETGRARALLMQEARMLEFLAGTSIAAQVPQLIAQFEHEGCFVLMLTAVTGVTADNRFTGKHWRFLSRLVLDQPINICTYLFDVKRLPQRLTVLHGGIVDTLSRAVTWLEAARACICRAAVVHGDFAPWNIRVDRASVPPEIFVFDWELGYEVGLPGWDVFHFIVQTDVLVRRRSAAAILRHLETLFGNQDARDYLLSAGLTSGDVKALLMAYLTDIIISGFEADPIRPPLQKARADLLELILRDRS